MNAVAALRSERTSLPGPPRSVSLPSAAVQVVLAGATVEVVVARTTAASVSRPFPPTSVSGLRPADQVIPPALPISLSLPGPPQRRSSPPRPSILSLPPSPRIWSGPAVPFSTSLPRYRTQHVNPGRIAQFNSWMPAASPGRGHHAGRLRPCSGRSRPPRLWRLPGEHVRVAAAVAGEQKLLAVGGEGGPGIRGGVVREVLRITRAVDVPDEDVGLAAVTRGDVGELLPVRGEAAGCSRRPLRCWRRSGLRSRRRWRGRHLAVAGAIGNERDRGAQRRPGRIGLVVGRGVGQVGDPAAVVAGDVDVAVGSTGGGRARNSTRNPSGAKAGTARPTPTRRTWRVAAAAATRRPARGTEPPLRAKTTKSPKGDMAASRSSTSGVLVRLSFPLPSAFITHTSPKPLTTRLKTTILPFFPGPARAPGTRARLARRPRAPPRPRRDRCDLVPPCFPSRFVRCIQVPSARRATPAPYGGRDEHPRPGSGAGPGRHRGHPRPRGGDGRQRAGAAAGAAGAGGRPDGRRARACGRAPGFRRGLPSWSPPPGRPAPRKACGSRPGRCGTPPAPPTTSSAAPASGCSRCRRRGSPACRWCCARARPASSPWCWTPRPASGPTPSPRRWPR